MQRSAVIICVLVALPLLALAAPEEEAPAADAAAESSEKFDVKGDRPKAMGLFDLGNMTEDEWHEEQYKQFQEKEFNAFQKQQFVQWEKQRFLQWQQARFAEAQQKKHAELAKENEKFVVAQRVELDAERVKHEKWLKSLLANEKERKKLLKQIKNKENKAQGDL